MRKPVEQRNREISHEKHMLRVSIHERNKIRLPKSKFKGTFVDFVNEYRLRYQDIVSWHQKISSNHHQKNRLNKQIDQLKKKMRLLKVRNSND